MSKIFFKVFVFFFAIASQYIYRTGTFAIEAETLSQPLVSMDPNDVIFYTFPSRNIPNRMREVVIGDVSSLQNSGIVRNSEIRIFIHGFLANLTTGGCLELRHAYLKRGYHNFICLDWGKLSGPNIAIIPIGFTQLAFYPRVAYQSTRVVANRLAEFIIFLKHEKVVTTYANIHLIGHSLGAHISGETGYYIQRKTKNFIGRITGLDPAGPLYDMSLIPDKYSLKRDSALFVEAIHTDALVYGTSQVLGDVDYFANGGRGIDQPQCGLVEDINEACGHTLAVDYFERAILGEKLAGCRCSFHKRSTIKQPCPKPKKCRRIAKFNTVLNERFFGAYYLSVSVDPPPNIALDYRPYNTSGKLFELLE